MPRTQPKPPIKLARLDNERDYLTPDEMEKLINGAKKEGDTLTGIIRCCW